MQTAVKLSTPPLSLGEGCMWHAARHMLCFVVNGQNGWQSGILRD